MPKLQILGGAYSDASLIAGAQRAVNVYPEINPKTSQAPDAVTHYPRPGLTPPTPAGKGPALGFGRCLYTATNGDVYSVVGQNIYYIDPNFIWTLLGQMQVAGTGPVYMADNGTDIIAVDGTAFGVSIHMATRAVANIADPNFFGGNRISFLDYFLLLNEPNTPNFYSSEVNSITFNALFFGTKTAWPDNCIALMSTERTIWLFGPFKGEIWANAGTVPFAFQAISGVIIEHGIAGSNALARQDVNVYWLSESPEGARMAMRGYGQSAQRISTHAIEEAWLGYPRADDCIVQTYQIRGHAFVLFHFPTADRTWVWDEATQEWHEEAYHDNNGVQHRTRDCFMTYGYGKNLSLDWQNGTLYQRDETNFTDNGQNIVFVRTMAHMQDDEFSRITLWRVIADMECGSGSAVVAAGPWSLGFSNGFGPAVLIEEPQVTLRVSRDRGFTFETHSDQPMINVTSGGISSQYAVRPTWNRCGVANDFVLELSWTGPIKSALNSVFVVTEEHEADV